MKNYEDELPENYIEIKKIDATDKKTTRIFSLLSFGILLVAVGVTLAVIWNDFVNEGHKLGSLAIHFGIFAVTLILYTVMHEAVHGICYKALTKKKLTFGLTMTVAYCGVPDIYVYRRAALIAVLAPFVVFSAVFGALPFLIPTMLGKLLSGITLGVHVGGCVGDLYVTAILLKYRDRRLLMRDTGPKQTFYLPNPAEPQENQK